MTINKIPGSAVPSGLDPREAAAIAAVKSQEAASRAQRAASSEPARPTTAAVEVSTMASQIAQAVKGSSSEEVFDQKKVDRLRKEIAEGRVPIDAEKLARKFLDLEQALGDLGRS